MELKQHTFVYFVPYTFIINDFKWCVKEINDGGGD